MTPVFKLTSERTLLIRFPGGMSLSNHKKVQAAFDTLFGWDPRLIRNLHPAYASLLVEFDPKQMEMGLFLEKVKTAVSAIKETVEDSENFGATVEIPVLYDGEDLDSLARELSISIPEIIQLHSSTLYNVFFLGFQPGFPYLGELPLKLRVPRLATPRVRVPAGSVAIAGAQTGIYPQESGGGWRLLGRTPTSLFNSSDHPPTKLKMGDRVRFRPIEASEFAELWEKR